MNRSSNAVVSVELYAGLGIRQQRLKFFVVRGFGNLLQRAGHAVPRLPTRHPDIRLRFEASGCIETRGLQALQVGHQVCLDEQR